MQTTSYLLGASSSVEMLIHMQHEHMVIGSKTHKGCWDQIIWGDYKKQGYSYGEDKTFCLSRKRKLSWERDGLVIPGQKQEDTGGGVGCVVKHLCQVSQNKQRQPLPEGTRKVPRLSRGVCRERTWKGLFQRPWRQSLEMSGYWMLPSSYQKALSNV